MSDDTHSIRSGGLTATIKAQGAELCALSDAAGTEFIWQAGAAWPRHAPLLFPIVGRLKDDAFTHAGRPYWMTQHGFARDLRFDWVERTPARCVLMLRDSEATRAVYPFAFELTACYSLDETGLELTLTIANTGRDVLLASLGGHPAFNWPLQPGVAKEDYTLTFARAEPHPVRRLEGGLLRDAKEPSPVRGNLLPLSQSLFADDAVIFDRIESNSVRYAAAGQGPNVKASWLEMSWSGFHQLGIWSKPSGAPFLCIEPWHGHASPSGFDGALDEKPGMMHLAPGSMKALSFRIRVGTDAV